MQQPPCATRLGLLSGYDRIIRVITIMCTKSLRPVGFELTTQMKRILLPTNQAKWNQRINSRGLASLLHTTGLFRNKSVRLDIRLTSPSVSLRQNEVTADLV
ncbi:uncharacterized protein LOC129965468 [Argiope bruennichi]|uniref:uncharacterized protein LOC129965468 n=1 Tax=Argiope bruennichi TaxID=94029 RepID=UPI0024950B42|nr:uncharacterized protein LOC129965468 [Argiope bruennichi]